MGATLGYGTLVVMEDIQELTVDLRLISKSIFYLCHILNRVIKFDSSLLFPDFAHMQYQRHGTISKK